MWRIEKLLAHPVFITCIESIETAETNRQFCRHGQTHLLDVARISYILNLEASLGIEKELLYAAALAHDIGRARQYQDGTNHHQAGADIASAILPECGFSEADTRMISSAIAQHKNKKVKTHKTDRADKTDQEDNANETDKTDCEKLADLLFRADKLSRRCSDCLVSENCYWPDEYKNKQLSY